MKNAIVDHSHLMEGCELARPQMSSNQSSSREQLVSSQAITSPDLLDAARLKENVVRTKETDVGPPRLCAII